MENHFKSEKDVQKLTDRLKPLNLPGFDSSGDALDYEFLSPLLKFHPELFNGLDLGPFDPIPIPYILMDEFTPAKPRVEYDRSLEFDHATYVSPSVGGHSDSGLAVYHSEMMGPLGSEKPGVSLTYKFPDVDHFRYSIKFQIWMYNLNGTTGADFKLVSSGPGYAGSTANRHINLPGSEFKYLTFSPTGSAVKNKTIKFEIQHTDWEPSTTHWWFYKATVSSWL